MIFGAPKKIEVKYDDETVQKMLSLLQAAHLPDQPPVDSETPWKLGMDLGYLKMLRDKFLTEWSWSSLEKRIAKYDSHLVHYEHEGDSLDLHFVHAKSQRSDAVPLMLLHGWPGTFFDFHKVIEPLTDPKDPSSPAFHVVVPSLPGYILSTLPRREFWGLTDIARVYNGLMTSVLGYQKYVAQGGDWGSMILRIMASTYPESVSLAHFNMFVSPVHTEGEITLSEHEKRMMKRGEETRNTGIGYFMLQSTKPFTIGYAISSSPLAMLAYIGEKIYSWSDPKLVDPQDILDTVALYYLSGSFSTSVMMYYSSSIDRIGYRAPASEGKFLLTNKFGFSAYPYELLYYAKSVISAFGPLVYYKEHSSGGHFPALDSPKDYVDDLREFVFANKDSLDGAKL